MIPIEIHEDCNEVCVTRFTTAWDIHFLITWFKGDEIAYTQSVSNAGGLKEANDFSAILKDFADYLNSWEVSTRRISLPEINDNTRGWIRKSTP